MKKCLVVIVLLFGFLVTACAADNTKNVAATASGDDYIENHYVFTGESDNWTGEMNVDSTLQFYEKDGVLGCDSNEDHKLTVTYRGDVSELSSAQHLKINFDAGPSSGGLEEEHIEDPIQQKTFTIRGGGNGAQIQQDEIITITVTIDGKSESFEMKNNNL